MSEKTTKPNGGSKEIETVEVDPNELKKRMEYVGFDKLVVAMQVFATSLRDKTIDAEDTTANSETTGSESMLYDPKEGKTVTSNSFIVPIIQGPIISYRTPKKKKEDRVGKENRDRDEK